MIKNVVFDLGNVLVKDSPLIVLKDLNISDNIKKNMKLIKNSILIYLGNSVDTLKL